MSLSLSLSRRIKGSGGSRRYRNRRSAALLAVLIGAAVLQVSGPAQAAEDRTVTRNGFTLEFRDLTGEGDQAVADRMVELFFAVYPQLVAEFNPGAAHTVILAIDPEWKGQAAASGNRVMVNPDYLKQRPQDLDMLVHELMHVVQEYHYTEAPGWLIEGIADYVRDRFGIDNAAAGWRLEPPMVGADYSQSYRVTGAFLRWVEANGRPGFVRTLNTRIREKAYDASAWPTLTGKSVEDLWADYTAAESSGIMPDNPRLALLTPEQLQRLHQFTPEQVDVFRAQIRGTAMEAQVDTELGVPAAVLQVTGPAGAAENRIVTRNGFTLDFRDLTGEGDQAVVDRMTELFFATYPRLVAEFNPSAARTVILTIDPDYEGVAAVTGNRVMIDPDYLRSRPQDIDLLTHELMHIVQAYSSGDAPGWLVEGIADYVRDRFGTDNAAAGWRLEAPRAGADYTDGYRVTGAFLLWVEAEGRPGFVQVLNTRIREKTYDASTWRTLAGKPLTDLWADYVGAKAVAAPAAAPPLALIDERGAPGAAPKD